jgi:hypothetical protein
LLAARAHRQGAHHWPHPESAAAQRRSLSRGHEAEDLGEIRDKLKEIDISNLTPLEALNILQFLKTKSDKFQ